MFDRKKYMAEYQKQWRNKNPEYMKKYNKKYYKRNKENILKQCKEYRESHIKIIREKDLERKRNYSKTENGKATHQRAKYRRRTILKNTINTLTAQEWLDILVKHDCRCIYCGKKLIDSFDTTRDHVIPISKGGNNVKENIVPACKSCNSKKGKKIMETPVNNL
ncbi:HNH endonuclease [Candidatus Atribacteria bacterium 1244-E10-H5-B2]|nr:MAG: HNH endonuclease [Candidatus Atribacteria bacterium 1244-E10-H5-B2]